MSSPCRKPLHHGRVVARRQRRARSAPCFGAEPSALPRPDRGRGRPLLGRRSAPRRARGRPTAVILCRRAHARGLACQGTARAATARPPVADRRSPSFPMRRHSRPPCGWPGCSTHSHARPRQHQPPARRRGHTLGLQRAHGQRIFVEQDDGYALLDVPSAWEVSPSACRWPCARRRPDRGARHRADHSTRDRAGDRHPRRPPARFLLQPLRSTATTAPRPCRSASSATPLGSPCGRSPTPTSAAASRRVFRLDPQAGTTIEAVGRDAVLFARRRSRRQPLGVTVVTAPATRAGFRFTGGWSPRPRPRRQALTTRRPRPGSGRRWPGRSR